MKPPHTKYCSIADQMRDMLSLSNQEIAERLGCKVHTVMENRKRIANGFVPHERFWTAERDAELRRLLAERYSATDIARIVGAKSRNAVLGRVHRLGLACKSGRNGTRVGAKRSRINCGKHTPHQWHAVPKPLSPVHALKLHVLPIPPPAETDIARISVMDIEPHHCRWVCSTEGDPLYAPRYCGERKVPGLPYCITHAKRAFVVPQPRAIRVQQRELVVA